MDLSKRNMEAAWLGRRRWESEDRRKLVRKARAVGDKWVAGTFCGCGERRVQLCKRTSNARYWFVWSVAANRRKEQLQPSLRVEGALRGSEICSGSLPQSFTSFMLSWEVSCQLLQSICWIIHQRHTVYTYVHLSLLVYSSTENTNMCSLSPELHRNESWICDHIYLGDSPCKPNTAQRNISIHLESCVCIRLNSHSPLSSVWVCTYTAYTWGKSTYSTSL